MVRHGLVRRTVHRQLRDQDPIEPPAMLVARYVGLLPATAIAEMLGAPVAMRRRFLDWGAGAPLSLDLGLSYRDVLILLLDGAHRAPAVFPNPDQFDVRRAEPDAPPRRPTRVLRGYDTMPVRVG